MLHSKLRFTEKTEPAAWRQVGCPRCSICFGALTSTAFLLALCSELNTLKAGRNRGSLLPCTVLVARLHAVGSNRSVAFFRGGRMARGIGQKERQKRRQKWSQKRRQMEPKTPPKLEPIFLRRKCDQKNWRHFWRRFWLHCWRRVWLYFWWRFWLHSLAAFLAPLLAVFLAPFFGCVFGAISMGFQSIPPPGASSRPGPRRPIQRPFRDTQKLPPNCLQVPPNPKPLAQSKPKAPRGRPDPEND